MKQTPASFSILNAKKVNEVASYRALSFDELDLKRLQAEKTRRNALQAMLFVFPGLLFLAVFTWWPLVETVSLSFWQWNMVSPVKKWLGFANYLNLTSNREFWLALRHTFEYVALLLGLNVILPYICAFGVVRAIRRGQDFYKTTIFLPSMLSLSVASLIFLWIFNPLAGPVGEVMRRIGLDTIDWLRSPSWVVVALAVITAWKCFGYNFIVLLSGLMAVPRELVEAARLDGMTNRQLFLRLMLPLSSSTALYVGVVTVVMGLQYVFVPIHMLTNGGPDQGSTNLVFYIYQIAFQFFQTGRAAACAVLTMIIFTVLVFLQGRVAERKVYYEN